VQPAAPKQPRRAAKWGRTQFQLAAAAARSESGLFGSTVSAWPACCGFERSAAFSSQSAPNAKARDRDGDRIDRIDIIDPSLLLGDCRRKILSWSKVQLPGPFSGGGQPSWRGARSSKRPARAAMRNVYAGCRWTLRRRRRHGLSSASATLSIAITSVAAGDFRSGVAFERAAEAVLSPSYLHNVWSCTKCRWSLLLYGE